MPHSPIFRKLARRGGSEDGLAEAFEEFGDSVEAGAAAVHPPQHRLQLVRDPLLLSERSDGMTNSARTSLIERLDKGPLAQAPS